MWMSHGHFKCVESALQTFSYVLCKYPISYPMLKTLHHIEKSMETRIRIIWTVFAKNYDAVVYQNGWLNIRSISN